MTTGSVSGPPRTWLRLEGLATLCVAVALYEYTGASWVQLAVLFFVPDLSFAAYLAGPRAGSIVYNALHSYVGPIVLGLVLFLMETSVSIPLVWLAHIGFDRALGYGLKYASAFQDTHLGRIGKRS